MKMLKYLSLLSLAAILMSCKAELIFSEREYFGGGSVLKFNSDKTYTYYSRSESYIKTFSRGMWRQEGKRLILLNGVSSVDELPSSIQRFEPSAHSKQTIVVNIKPLKQVDWEQSVTDIINVEMVADGKVYVVKSPVSMIDLKSNFRSAYFRAYPKPNSLNICEQLNDTLRSKPFNFPREEESGILVNLDINPLYFSQVKLRNDTLWIINDRKIKWNRNYLERAKKKID